MAVMEEMELQLPFLVCQLFTLAVVAVELLLPALVAMAAQAGEVMVEVLQL
jgi:hypothetical protein